MQAPVLEALSKSHGSVAHTQRVKHTEPFQIRPSLLEALRLGKSILTYLNPTVRSRCSAKRGGRCKGDLVGSNILVPNCRQYGMRIDSSAAQSAAAPSPRTRFQFFWNKVESATFLIETTLSQPYCRPMPKPKLQSPVPPNAVRQCELPIGHRCSLVFLKQQVTTGRTNATPSTNAEADRDILP